MTKEQLLPSEVLKKLPPLDGIHANGEELIAQAKFFYPDFGWTWYAVAYDGEEEFFGLVDGYEQELGYFSLGELLENRGKHGCPIERDLYFRPTPIRDLLREKQVAV
jgi:hypothetical protein